MSLSPRQRVLTAFAHQTPDRIPFSWGFGPTGEMTATLRTHLAAQGLNWDQLRELTDDLITLHPSYIGPALPADTDLWGIRRQPQAHDGGAYNEMQFHPLAGFTSVDQIHAHPWPRVQDLDCSALPKMRDQADPHHRRAVKVFGGNPLEIYSWMTGLEETFSNLIERPEVVVAGFDHITAYFEARLHAMTAALGPDDIDTVLFADDLGSQQGLLISRSMYREFLQPFHRRLTFALKTLAPQAIAMFHSDGAVFDILPDLLDAGVQVLEAVQVDAAGMDPARLKAAYGPRLGFHGGISVQQLLPHATPAQVVAECHKLVATFGAGGGYVAAPTHCIQVGTPVENVLAMLRTVLGDQDFQSACAAAKTNNYLSIHNV